MRSANKNSNKNPSTNAKQTSLNSEQLRLINDVANQETGVDPIVPPPNSGYHSANGRQFTI